ncbi:MAG: DNA adenine methylase [Flammeovirgaceae bacterium]
MPQQSPFRYPGGKTWLIPTVRQWLKQNHKSANILIEPFAGGGIVSLTAAFEKLADHITMVEMDEEIAYVVENFGACPLTADVIAGLLLLLTGKLNGAFAGDPDQRI